MAVAGADVPCPFVNVTETDVSVPTLPCKVNGCVRVNWPPKAVDCGLWNHVVAALDSGTVALSGVPPPPTLNWKLP